MATTTQRRQSKKVAQREGGFDEPNKYRKLPGGAKLRPKRLWGGGEGSQNLTSGVDRLGPKRSLLGDLVPNPNEEQR